MLPFKIIREQLRDCSLIKVSKQTGISYPILKKIMNGNENCNVNTIKTISDYIINKQL